ncbi:hypothetical protein [Streptomyces sp. NBC_00986]|uniref:hypothetical protein n=1 Tax=Streptomyces sp. NBC_00986 TaxID=2903702 RepID=UPI0038644B71|nr:hypothetical protein OG504_18550 [Streptomyces sp. NBC_00986]
MSMLPSPPQPPEPSQPPPPESPYGPSAAHGWGVQPVPAPPSPLRRRTQLALRVLAVVLGLGFVVNVAIVRVREATAAEFPKAEYELTLPGTLLDGRYRLAHDLSGTTGRELEEKLSHSRNSRVNHAVVARYSLYGEARQGALVISGFSGRLRNTGAIRAGALKGFGAGAGKTVIVPPKDVTPAGSGTGISCEIVTDNSAGPTYTFPVCAWADGNTSALVAEMTFGGVSADLDLKSAARTVLVVRSEVRTPIK